MPCCVRAVFQGIVKFVACIFSGSDYEVCLKGYRDADKSLARTGRKQANVSVRMVLICFSVVHCGERN